MSNAQQSGFTLIELMITVVIIGILASIAYPSYTRYATQTRRSDAQVALTQLANQQEKFFAECNPPHYAASTAGAARTCGTGPNYTDSSLAYVAAGGNYYSPDRHYLITITVGALRADGTVSATCNTLSCGYSIVANPNGTGVTGRQNNDGRFMLNSLNQKFWDRNNDGDYADANEDKWTK